jgi:hypothetical protein
MGFIYYKQIIPGALTFFVVNTVTRNIEGMFKECKTKNILSLMRDLDTSLWYDIDHNELAKAMIASSIQITQAEYEAAEFVMKAMVETDYWLLSEDKIEESYFTPAEEIKEVVTETVYC